MLVDYSCIEFTDKLAAKTPVPGGGGASALTGALGIALGSMVCNYTIGKKKYKNVEDDVKVILKKASKLQSELLSLVDMDATAFEPLSRAYSMPNTTGDEKKLKDKIMEEALKEAALVPFKIMKTAVEAISLHEELLNKGSKIIISDIGVGVILCKASLEAASLNVYVNTNLMKDKNVANMLNKKTAELLELGVKKANEVYKKVQSEIITS